MATASQLHYFAALARVVDELGRNDFWPTACDFLEHVCPLDEVAVFQYVWSEHPERLYDRKPTRERDRLHGELLSAAYLIGPYYNRVVKAQADTGFYPIDAIAPEGFRDSEYYKIYFREKRAADEGMFYAPFEPGIAIGLLVERRLPSPAFTAAELETCQATAPLVAALVRRHRSLGNSISRHRPQVGDQMVTALECFGRDVLSKREREIAELILRGHSSKSGARELGISPETERVHRKRLYHKLAISSQSELFWLFIQSVEHFDPVTHNDPLRSMLESR